MLVSSAFWINEDGTYQVLPGYYFYKQVTRAGQPGMAVARATSMSSERTVIAFSSNGTDNPDVFVIINNSEGWDQKVQVNIKKRPFGTPPMQPIWLHSSGRIGRNV